MSAAGPPRPVGVLVQSIAVDDEGERAGYRIFADGRYQTLARGGGWVDGAPLDDARWRPSSGRSTRPRSTTSPGATRATPTAPATRTCSGCRSRAGGAVRTVSVVGRRRVPELERLTAALTDAFRS